MWLKLSQLKASLNVEENQLNEILAKTLQLPSSIFKNIKIDRKSLDARHKEPIFVYHLIFEIEEDSIKDFPNILERNSNLSIYRPTKTVPLIRQQQLNRTFRPVIVGAGPAGLFAGLKLAAAGYQPMIIERGDGLIERIRNVDRFWKEGILDPDSNIQFGVGGAGTFSDGKLTTRIKDQRLAEILQMMVKLGGPPDILYWQSPHIGTDLLREVVTNLQQMIIEYGGELFFRHQLTDIELENGKNIVLTVNHRNQWETDLLVLAVGNSARDVYGLLHHKGFQLQLKPFAVGVRIEHPQDLINKAQYGKWAGHPKLGPAEYRLTYQHPESGRGVYTFCMCPGGSVVGATSEFSQVVTNGMSYHSRNSGIANAAIVVTVNPNDFESESPLAGIIYQQKLERQAFKLGGSNYFAPVQRVGDFLKVVPSIQLQELVPSYLPGVKPANLWDLFPPKICQALRDSIKYFGRQLRGFDWPDAILTGVETRTSAPLRILRDEYLEAIGFSGIYPVGEGAGYAGGIISSALDGWKVAEEIINRQKD